MSTNPFFTSQKTTPVVSIPIQEEDEDTDICPVCDGQCTCHATTTAVQPTLAQIRGIKGPLTMAELSIKYSAAAASAASGVPAGPSSLQQKAQAVPATVQKPSLKIKFTVPQTLLAKQKRRLGLGAVAADSGRQTGSHNKNKSHQGVSTSPGLHKRSSTTTRTTTIVATKNRTKQKPKTEQKQRQDVVKARAAPLVKRVASAGRRKKRSSKYDEESSLTSLSDVEMEYADEYGDGRLYPTFLSASALESFESGSESGSDSSSDSSPLEGEIEKEEERFIIGEEKEKAREKARMRRELLGDHHHHNPHNNNYQNQSHNNEWVIHSRKKSVGLSEGEEGLDVDSDDDDGSDDEEDEEEDEGDADPSSATALAFPGDDTLIDSSTDTQRRRKYGRLGTSWTLSSSSDESNFDADLFFRHLYDSSSSSSSSSGNESTANGVFAGEDSDADTQIAFEEGEGGEMVDAVANVVELESLPFELAESWDGGVVFTNGIASGDARGDFGFAGFPSGFGGGGSGGGGDRISVGPGIGRGKRRKGKEKAMFGFGDFGGDADMDMEMSMSGCSSDGYLEEDGECEGESFMFDDEDSFTGCGGGVGGVDDQIFVDDEGEGSGETTDEDLVGADLLPNERAMRLFKLPSPMWGAVGAVDPLSLFAREDHGRRRPRKKRKGKARDNRKGKKPREMLSPLDILAGKVALWDSQDDMDLDDEFCSSQEGDWTSLDGSPSNSIPIRKQSRRKAKATSPRTPTPTPTTPPASTVTTSTRTGSRSISCLSGPRKGVFVLPTPTPPPPVLGEVPVRTNRSLRAETQQEKKAVVVIGEDRKGADVPSPHPRRRQGANGSGGSVDGASIIEQLLRRHLTESLGSINTPNDTKDSNTTNGAPFSPLTLDESMTSSVEAASSHHMHAHCLELIDISRPFGLDDVLDTTFLNDDDDDEEAEEDLFNIPKAGSKVGIVQSSAEEDGSGGVSASITDGTLPPPPSTSSESDLTTTTTTTTPNLTSSTPLSLQATAVSTTTTTTSDVDAAADAAAAKNLSRWDVISVSAFRQTQIQGDGIVGHGTAATSATVSSRHGRTPASSADFGNAMKSSSPLTMLWRGSGGQNQHHQKGGVRNTSGSGNGGGAASSLIRRTASGGNIVNDKHAKKRRLMMSGAGEMSLPLVLPSTSSGVRERTPTPTTTMTGAGSSPSSTPNNTNTSKTRKEARRERKHKKRKGYPSGGVGPHQSSSHHQHAQHPHHTYHQHHHHPNAKSRGVSSMQRLGWGGSGWGSGGGGGGHGYGGGGGGGWGVGGGGGGGFVPMGL